MASKIDFSSLTLNEEEARDSSELIFEETWAKPELNETHDIQTGVEMDTYIPIMGQLGLVGQIDPGDCSTNEGGTIPTSQKKWTPVLVSFRLTHCQTQIPTLLKFWKKSRISKNTWEDVDNEMISFIEDKAIDATLDSILRIADFASTTSSPVGDGTGDEDLTAGTNKTFFNMIDGMWKQVFTDQAGAKAIYRHTITENGEASKTAQLALASDAAIKAMRAMYENIDPRAFNGNLVFQMTRTMLNNWQTYLEEKSVSFTLQEIKDGTTKFTYRGIPIVVRYDWDRIIQTYKNLGTTYELPHRVVLTDLMNIPIGTSDEESMKELESHYNKTDKKHYIDVAYKIDMKILLEYAMAVAY